MTQWQEVWRSEEERGGVRGNDNAVVRSEEALRRSEEAVKMSDKE